MDNIGKILEFVKLYGISSVVTVAMFLYFNSRISKLEEKYEGCMNARINEAYRADLYNGNLKVYKQVAVLPKPIRVKRKDA